MPKAATRPKFQGLFLTVLSVLVFLLYGVRGQGGGWERFGEYREYLQRSDTTAALNLVQSLCRDDTTLDAQMANFLLAVRALERGDTHDAAARLAHPIPEGLWDHAVWLQAAAFQNAQQDSLAGPLWVRIASDTSSVYAEDALYELALSAAAKSDLDSLNRMVNHSALLTRGSRSREFRLLQAETLARTGQHAEAVAAFYDLAINSADTYVGQAAREHLTAYFDDHSYHPRVQTWEELERELETLSRGGRFQWGLDRVKEESRREGWQKHNDMLLFYQGRYRSGLGQHRAAIQDLKNCRSAYPMSPFALKALYYLGRSAYLDDQDSLAIASLTRVVDNASDTVLSNQALEVLGLLYIDRHRSQDAAAVLKRWVVASKNRPSHADALWRLGWALWDIQDFEGARSAWFELSPIDSSSEYAPASLYWSARAADQIGAEAMADSTYHVLDSAFTFSYYSIIRRRHSEVDTDHDLPLNPPKIDDLCLSSGLHTRKLGLLAAMRLPALALRELPAAGREIPNAAGLSWWKAQLQFWDGDRLGAWRTLRSELGRYVRTGGPRPADFYRIAYPLDSDSTVVRLSAEYKLDPHFVLGLICQESHFEAEIVSPAGAIGLMQLMPGTASMQARKLGIDFATPRLYTPAFNLQLGIAHLADLMSEFNGDTVLVLASYNAGKNAVYQWQAEFGNDSPDVFVEKIPYRETRLFVKRVLEHTAAYRRLYPDLASRS